jgi:hypothetical protein
MSDHRSDVNRYWREQRGEQDPMVHYNAFHREPAPETIPLWLLFLSIFAGCIALGSLVTWLTYVP